MFQAFILGLVQGVGEFLPISSSAHLIVIPQLLGWKDQGLAFDVALHWATLLAVVMYFRKDLFHIIKGFWHSLFSSTRDVQNNIYQKLSWMLIVASMPAAVVGKLFEDSIEQSLRTPVIPAITMTLFGLVLLVADHWGRKTENMEGVTWGKALAIGCAQVLSLVPGVSRSGSTITAGLFSGLTREAAAKFSFLLAVPITLGAGILKLPDITHISAVSELTIGFVTAFVAAFLSIKFLLAVIGRVSYKSFVVYRVLFSLVILAVLWLN